MEISHNPTNSICSQDHKQQTVTHTSYANFGTHPAWQWFILPRARATARRRRITATCLNMLQHASTDDTEGHAWPMSSCISLKGQALPAHTFSPTSQFNCHNSIGGRPRGVRISSWPSCASHLSVQTPAATIRHQAETVGAEVHLRHAGSPTNSPYVKIRDDRRLNTIPLLYLLGLTMFIFNVIYMYVLNFTLFGTCIWLLTSYVITSTTIKLYRY